MPTENRPLTQQKASLDEWTSFGLRGGKHEWQAAFKFMYSARKKIRWNEHGGASVCLGLALLIYGLYPNRAPLLLRRRGGFRACCEHQPLFCLCGEQGHTPKEFVLWMPVRHAGGELSECRWVRHWLMLIDSLASAMCCRSFCIV